MKDGWYKMKKIKMQLFGEFVLTEDEITLGEEQLRSNKLITILAYIMMNRDNILTYQKLIDVFWEEDSRNPKGALKNQIYRIRNTMKELGPEEYICTVPGGYRWNPDIEVETDYEAFEDMVKKLERKEIEPEEKESLCREILSCYKGNVSGRIASESWIVPKVTWYQIKYIEAVKSLSEILSHQNKWTEVEKICRQTVLIDSFDEDIHCWIILSLYGQGKYDETLEYYDQVNRYYYKNMGIRHSEKLRATFQKILSYSSSSVMDMDKLMEDIKERDKKSGAFLCDYQIFRQIYQIEARRIDRLGVAEYVVFFTLHFKGDVTKVDQMLLDGVDVLEEAILSSLRTGDVVSQCSKNQFVVMLQLCSYESALKVIKRIQDKFHRLSGKNSLEIVYELEEVSSES